MKKKLLNAKGFTLIELMVVMAIIAVLAVMIIGAITIARATAKETIHRSNAKTLQVGLESYFASNRTYPTIAAGTTFEAAATTLNVVLSTGGTCTGGGGTLQANPTAFTVGGKLYNYQIQVFKSGCTVNVADEIKGP